MSAKKIDFAINEFFDAVEITVNDCFKATGKLHGIIREINKDFNDLILKVIGPHEFYKLLWVGMTIVDQGEDKDAQVRTIQNGFGYVLCTKNNKEIEGITDRWDTLINNYEEAKKHLDERYSLFKLFTEGRLARADCIYLINNKEETDLQPSILINSEEIYRHKVMWEMRLIEDEDKFERFQKYLDFLLDKPLKRYELNFYCARPLYHKTFLNIFKSYGEIYVAAREEFKNQDTINILLSCLERIALPFGVLFEMNARKELQKQKEELKKSEEMLNLLLKPLDGISASIEKLQKDSQELQAILYHPHRAIFLAAPRVWKYFEEGTKCNIGSIQWEVVHKPQYYSKLSDYVCTLTAIVKEIFSDDSIQADIRDSMDLLRKLLFSSPKTDPRYGLRELCKKIINVNEDQVIKWTKQLESNIDINAEKHDKNTLTNALNAFKYILHTPYKPGGQKPWLPLIIILCEKRSPIFYNVDSSKCESSDLSDFITKINNQEITDINVSIPVPSYSMLLNLIEGFLIFKPDNKDLELDETNITRQNGSYLIEMKFSNFNFKDYDPKNFASVIRLAKDSNHRFEGGDFLKPFLDFIYNCKATVDKAHINCTENKSDVNIIAGNIRLQVSNNRFSIEMDGSI